MTIEQLEKIEWLNRAYHANNKANSLLAVNEENKKLKELSSICTEEKRKEVIKTIESNENKINEYVDYLAKLRNEIGEAISSINDDECEAILNYRYLAYKTMEKISDLMHYDKSTVQRKHKKAIEKLLLKSTPCMV